MRRPARKALDSPAPGQHHRSIMRGLLSGAEGALGSPIRNLLAILGFVILVSISATIAYMADGWSLFDAAYMVLLTIYTVGYGEVRPIDTTYLRAVTITTMVFGCTGMILLTGALVQIFTVIQLRQLFGTNRMQHRIDKLSNHVIICGYGRIGATLARDLEQAGTPLVIVDRGAVRLSEAEAAGFACLSGDATEEDVLVAAGIDRARALATVLPDDAANVFITLSARSLNTDIEIIARGEVPPTERKLRRAGANHVILPAHIGAERIARIILYPASEDLAASQTMARSRLSLGELGLDLEKFIVASGTRLCGMTIAEAERAAAGALMIVQINHGAHDRVARPSPDERIDAGDELLIVLRDAGNAARSLFGSENFPREPAD
ncbi:MAG: potassium channel protein [Sphingomonas sp.]|jgi:voltage-gated potassium channel